MELNSEMIKLFGENNLTYVPPKRLNSISISDKDKEFLLKVGFPNLFSYFRFSMEFEALSMDHQFGESENHLSHLRTIGCEGVSQLIGRFVLLSEIDLDNGASLSDIAKRVEELQLDDTVFVPEVTTAWRICFDLENGGRIVSVSPLDLSIKVMNSSIQQLAASIVAYQNIFLSGENESVKLEQFKRELINLDPQALGHQELVWETVIKRWEIDQEGY